MTYSPHSTSGRTAVLAAVAVGTLVLSACGSEEDTEATSPEPIEPSSTVTATDEVATADEPDGGTVDTAAGESPEPSTPAEDTDCEPDPESPVITEGIPNLPPPGLPNSTWVYNGDSNFNDCDDLTYATVEQDPQGNAQFKNKLMLFHQGQYSGFPPTEAPQQHTVVDTTEDSVTVEFKDWEALEEAGGSNAEAPEYTEEVTFRWEGDAVVTEGRIPNEP